MADCDVLVEFVCDAAGDRLRGVVRYREDDYRFLYDREDAGWNADEVEPAAAAGIETRVFEDEGAALSWTNDA